MITSIMNLLVGKKVFGFITKTDWDDFILGLVADFVPPFGLYALIKGPDFYIRFGALVGLSISLGSI